MEDAAIDAFVQWFQSNGGYVDLQVMGITEFSEGGRGAIALCDIPKGYTIFTLPRTLTLSTRTSPLPSLFGLDAWRAHGLHKGWVGLILCMMWEDAWAHESDVVNVGVQRQDDIRTTWGSYMRILPTEFDTPMLWNAEELEELQGTAVVDKIGRDDAERDYSEKVVPAIQTSLVLFPPSHHGTWYTLEAYHRAGSRILSRSFTVSRWTVGDNVEENDPNEAEVDDHLDTPIESSMHIDEPDPPQLENIIEGLDSNSEDDEEDDPSDIAMVPMADLLNAKWGSENAKLFYESQMLRMVTTKNIRQCEQIFNTYGDPPNSDLLRRYGHVDLVRLHPPSSVHTHGIDGDVEMGDDKDPETISCLGNPSDVVEIRADLIVHMVKKSRSGSKTEDDVRARIEWWLDEGEDDIFVIGLPEPGSQSSATLPPEIISLARLLMLSEADFRIAHSKGKLPKGKLKKDDAKESKAVLEILNDVFKERERNVYRWRCGNPLTHLSQDDEHLLSLPETLIKRKRHAVVVRLGEKRILKLMREKLRSLLAELNASSGVGDKNTKLDARDNKDVNGGKDTGSGRKRVSGLEGDQGRKRHRK
ncbi:hypothetical protein JVU11DRAFT_10716 [Chiua virens]|nr:hypothetical protein JVU11DRAFT_10716 [Chiua virens]